MLHKIISLVFLLTSILAKAEDGVGEFFGQLNAKRILETVPAQCIADGQMTPIAVRYVRRGDGAPSCGLLLKSGEYIDLVSPEGGGSLPACAAPLKAPVYFKLNDSYVVYEYSVEDPRAEFTKTYQLFRLAGDYVKSCKNDEQLTGFAVRNIKNVGVGEAFMRAVGRFGCK